MSKSIKFLFFLILNPLLNLNIVEGGIFGLDDGIQGNPKVEFLSEFEIEEAVQSESQAKATELRMPGVILKTVGLIVEIIKCL